MLNEATNSFILMTVIVLMSILNVLGQICTINKRMESNIQAGIQRVKQLHFMRNDQCRYQNLLAKDKTLNFTSENKKVGKIIDHKHWKQWLLSF